VLAVVREVTAELMGDRVTVSLDSDLERHLGLGSLERVELVTRLESSFEITLPDNALGEARTPRQLVEAVAAAQKVAPSDGTAKAGHPRAAGSRRREAGPAVEAANGSRTGGGDSVDSAAAAPV
jgi:acyl carrier protein